VADTAIDPQLSLLAVQMTKTGSTSDEIANATGLLPKEVIQVIERARKGLPVAGPARPAPRPAAAPAPFRPGPSTPVGRLAAPGGSFITVLRAGDLFIDHTYQRPLDDSRVAKMAASYDVALVGILEVSDRGDGKYAVVDGQHRWAMLVELDVRSVDTPVCCHVHRGLTVEQEAALFRDIDRGRRALTTWDRWHARLAAAEPTVVAIDRVVRTYNLVLSDQVRPSTIRATKTVEDIVAIGGTNLLGEVIDTLLTAWGPGADTFTAELLMGTAMVRAGYSQVDLGRLIDKLIETTPRQVSARARALRETQSGSLGRLVAVYMLSLYNATTGSKLGPLPGAAYFGDLKRTAAKTVASR
jgi:hypothetical protein